MPKFRWYYIFPAIPLYVFACLPMFIIHGFSDILRLFLFYVIGYRKKVVLENIRKSFPEKEEAWVQHTAFLFYRNLIDTMLETLSMATRTSQFYKNHVKVHKSEVLGEFTQKGQPVILVCGHIANWEWAGQGLHQTGIQVDVLYHPLTSEFFNWYIYFCRTRFGIHPIPMGNSLREMLQRKNIPSAITFIADQTPGPEGCLWMEFLNQDTPVFLGVEKLAKKFNYPVVYGEMVRMGRGYYEIDFSLVTKEPKETAEFEITRKHMQLLEEYIIKHPENWLWSHRRWKHKRPVKTKDVSV